MPSTPGRTVSAQVSRVVVVTVVTVALVCRVTVAGAQESGWRLPLEGGRVVAAFDPPRTTYGTGHRGVDLVGDATVTAPAAGTVAFSGQVAGERWVSLDHAGGLRTSYGPLVSIAVVVGATVAPGEVLGEVGRPHGGPPGLHWSARRDGLYLDPMLLVGRLRPALVGPGGWEATGVATVARYEPWDGDHRFGLVPGSPLATGPGYVHAPNPNHVVAIAGLSSATGEPPLDLTHLGFDPRDITELSYRGRDDAGGGQLPYDATDTWSGVEAAADRLDDELRARWRDAPTQAVDLVGHSMGGVVALWYLLTRYDPADPGLPPIGHVVTIASPLEGADLAAGLVSASEDVRARLVLALVGAVLGEDPRSPSVGDLVPGSPVIEAIADGWAGAGADPFAGPLATGTRVLTLGAESDLLVPEHRSDLPGAAHVVLPGTHDGVRRTEAARQVVHAFLADEPVPGEDGGLGHWFSFPVGLVERTAPAWLLPG